jgi:hypothetical protein
LAAQSTSPEPKHENDGDRDACFLSELLEEVLSVAADVRSPRGNERFDAVTLQQGAAITLAHKLQLVQDARRWLIPDDAAMVRAFGFIGEMGTREEWDRRAQDVLFEREPKDFSAELQRVTAMAHAAMRELNR